MGEAQQALALHGTELDGRKLSIRPAGGIRTAGGESSGKVGGSLPPRDSMDCEHSPASRASSGGGRSEPRTEIDALLEEALEEENGPLQLADFDLGSKRFLTELMQRDRAQGTRRSVDALEMVFQQTKHKTRDAVHKWPAYIFRLLQKFDPQLSDEIAAKRLLERDAERKRHAGEGARTKTEAPRVGDIARAWEFVPPATDGTKQVLDRWGKPVLL